MTKLNYNDLYVFHSNNKTMIGIKSKDWKKFKDLKTEQIYYKDKVEKSESFSSIFSLSEEVGSSRIVDIDSDKFKIVSKKAINRFNTWLKYDQKQKQKRQKTEELISEANKNYEKISTF